MTAEEQFPVEKTLLENYRKSVDLTNFPKKFMEWYEGASAEERTEWFEGRFRCLKYHLYLSGYVEATKPGDPSLPKEYVPILGMDFQPDPHAQLFKCFLQKRPGENLVLSDLDQLTKKRMILWPRGLFKTSAVRVDIVQTILNYPDVRICFLTGSDKLAKTQLAAIKKFFETPTKRFKWLFPEFCSISKEVKRKIVDETTGKTKTVADWMDVPVVLGNAHEFIVPCRPNAIVAEPTFAISTIRSTKAGSHYDLIYVDDIVNETNYRTYEALQKSYDSYIDICPILEPTGFMVVTGTRYSWGDAYETIQADAEREMKETGQTIWKFFIRDCWSHGCQNCVHTSVYHDYEKNILQPPCEVQGCKCPGFKDRGNRDVLFPQTRTIKGKSIGHTLKILENKLVESNAEFFANQYENKPIATGSQTFDETIIGAQTFHNLTDMPSASLGMVFGVGDLAYVGQEGRDYSVIYMCRAVEGRIYVYDCAFGNWDSGKVAEQTLNILWTHRPNVLYYEKVNGWDGFDRLIQGLATAKNLPKVPIQWEKGSQAKNSKIRRIGDIKGWLTSRRLWFYSGMPGYQTLVQQLIKWPKLGRHDDFADACGMIVAAPTGVQMQTPPKTESLGSWLNRLHGTTLVSEPDTRPAGSYNPETEYEK